jgi:endonuclease YncB( thermonuclease family)
VDRGTLFFWSLIGSLLGAAGYFALNAPPEQAASEDAGAKLETGQVVTFRRLVDAESAVVTTARGEDVSIQLLGVKAASVDVGGRQAPEGDPTSAAVAAMSLELVGRPARVLLHASGAAGAAGAEAQLATLLVEDRDVALALVRGGLALVYTPQPFAAMTLYLHEQEAARERKIGIWGDELGAAGADAVARRWQKEGPH